MDTYTCTLEEPSGCTSALTMSVLPARVRAHMICTQAAGCHSTFTNIAKTIKQKQVQLSRINEVQFARNKTVVVSPISLKVLNITLFHLVSVVPSCLPLYTADSMSTWLVLLISCGSCSEPSTSKHSLENCAAPGTSAVQLVDLPNDISLINTSVKSTTSDAFVSLFTTRLMQIFPKHF